MLTLENRRKCESSARTAPKTWWDNSETGVDRRVRTPVFGKSTARQRIFFFKWAFFFLTKKTWFHEASAMWLKGGAEAGSGVRRGSIRSWLAGPFLLPQWKGRDQNGMQRSCLDDSVTPGMQSVESMPALAIQGPPHIETARTASQ